MLLFLRLFLPLAMTSQGEALEVGGMTIFHELRDDSVRIALTAPTEGWLAIGFNNDDNIVGSDLIMFRVVENAVEYQDMHVVGLGDPRNDRQLGGTSLISIIDGEEAEGITRITFQVPLKSEDPYDFQHRPAEEFWLIMAYSTHDDFGHHSRMRRHVRYQF